MGQSMREIHRVLRPGGKLFISEPIFAGDFNDILRLFHDEQKVREAAFEAVQKAVGEGLFGLVKQTFFRLPLRFENFEDFKEQVLKVTYNNHVLEDSLYDTVKQKFLQHSGKDGGADFLMPMRVDLLEKLG